MANDVTIDVKTTGTQAMDALKKSMLSLAPAALPVAAAMVPLAANAGAATVAIAAFGAAVIPQIMTMADAAKAQNKYKDAVEQHGKASKQAVAAETAYLAVFNKMPPATQKASIAFGMLGDSFDDWSDSLASSTMPVFTKSFAVFQAMLPKTTPLVQGAAVQLDRLMTAAGGAVSGGAFDKLSKSFATFASGALKKSVDGIIHFSRVLSEGRADGPVQKFMDYANRNGPQVAETMRNLARAIGNLLEGAAAAGPGMLTLVNAMARMIAAVPAELIGRLLQLYTAFKLVRLGALGVTALTGGVAALRVSLLALATASATAGGGLAGLRAAFLSLSVAAKATVVIAAVAALVVGFSKLGSVGRKAGPDVDRLTTSLGNLGRNGKVAGEAARLFGKDLDGLYASIRSVSDPSLTDQVQQGLVKVFSLGFADSTPVKEAKKNLDGIDQALANLVRGGKADLAAAAFDKLKASYREGGRDTSQLTSKLEEYKSAMADAAFEQQLAADSMGLFGAQAQQVQTKLDAQKQSADGLAQSINALSNAALMARGGIRGMEAAIDAASEAFKKNGATLDENTEKGRANNQALDDLASSTMKAAESARENGASWKTVNGIFSRGRSQLIATAEQMGLTTAQAKRLADQILKTPDKTAKLKGNMEDLQAKLNAAKRKLKSVPDSRKAKVRADIRQLERAIARAKAQLRSIKNKSVSVTSHLYTIVHGNASLDQRRRRHGVATGGVIGAHAAEGGPRSNSVLVGEHGPEIVDLAPGSQVHSNPDSRRIAQSLGGGGGGGGSRPIVLYIDIGGKRLGELLIDPLRYQVRTKGGGNVQAYLKGA